MKNIYIVLAYKRDKREIIGFGSSKKMLDYHIDEGLIDDGTYDTIEVVPVSLDKYPQFKKYF